MAVMISVISKKKKEVMIGGTQILLSRICVPLI